eukprot:1137039-Pelagomonas_calceolata.AAC.1
MNSKHYETWRSSYLRKPLSAINSNLSATCNTNCPSLSLWPPFPTIARDCLKAQQKSLKDQINNTYIDSDYSPVQNKSTKTPAEKDCLTPSSGQQRKSQ